MSIVILCPHQDDEILSSFLLLSQLRDSGEDVKIIFATNGDYRGKDIARRRYNESVLALSFCNVRAKDIYYMGYGDTGMRASHSFLNRLYTSDPEQQLYSYCSGYTYHPADQQTIHYMFHGTEPRYSRAHFVEDLNDILHAFFPTSIVIPSTYDAHYDHRALAYFAHEAICGWDINVHSYLIHSGNDLQWPPRNTDCWKRPAEIPKTMWADRLIIKNRDASSRKAIAIRCFESQHPNELDGFLLSFSKPEEFFFQSEVPLSFVKQS